MNTNRKNISQGEIWARQNPKIPFTKEGYQKVLDEKAELLKERPDAVEHLRKAREMGDLSENGYYRAARSRLSSLDARLRKLERLRRWGVVVESTGSDRVEIGSTVRIVDGKKEYEYSLVGGYESDPSQKTISHISPLGKALMGKRKDDVIIVTAPAGTTKYTILEIL